MVRNLTSEVRITLSVSFYVSRDLQIFTRHRCVPSRHLPGPILLLLNLVIHTSNNLGVIRNP